MKQNTNDEIGTYYDVCLLNPERIITGRNITFFLILTELFDLSLNGIFRQYTSLIIPQTYT